MQLFSIYDSKSGTYSFPFPGETDGDAQRAVIAGLRTGKPLFAQFPADYSLVHCGSFDTSFGIPTQNPSGNVRHVTQIITLVEAVKDV